LGCAAVLIKSMEACQDFFRFWQAAPNVARKLFNPDRPEKSLHADRLGSSDDR
jgi:hypothetical protein